MSRRFHPPVFARGAVGIAVASLLLSTSACRERAVAGHRTASSEGAPPRPSSATPDTATPGRARGPEATAFEPPTAATAPAMPEDRGIFEDLKPEPPRLPAWLARGPVDIWQRQSGDTAYRLVAGVPVSVAAGDTAGSNALNSRAATRDAAYAAADADGDTIPDTLDILLGAKKTVLNAAHYRSTYHKLDYPGGDVPRNEGVCSDVVVRALRNAGFDLQRLVHEDLTQHPKRYPSVDKPDPNIDHRRVRVLLPWFEHHWDRLPLDAEGTTAVVLPGDVVFFDTLRGPEPDHLGIVSDNAGSSGRPLVINNWNDGHQTAEMDLLGSVPITHRFRIPSATVPVAASERGLGGVLARHGLEVPAKARQVLLVTTPTWRHSAATLRRYERASDQWQPVGTPLPARIGAKGLGKGLGLHPKTALGGLSDKREGDQRAPAGVFALGTAFGPETRAPTGVAWPWRQVSRGDVWVDDPGSALYNQWQRRAADSPWSSAEDLTMYRLGLVVEHNTSPAEPGAGSAIFLHTSDQSRPTAGCTALRRHDLETVLRWLTPDASPVLVQVGGHVYE